MAVPKRKTSKSAKNKRRSHHALKLGSICSCQNCGAMIKMHRVCRECGFYRKKEIIKKDN